MRIDSATGINSALTGSFSGSFKGTGDFTGLTADSVAYANVTGKPTLISSSAQVSITESQISDFGTYSTATGVENNADVTDTANVTAAGAVMDTEVTNLADVKAFDTSDYATAAQGAKADSAQQPPTEGAFANGDKTKLDGIEASADVTDTANVKTALNASLGGAATIGDSSDTITIAGDLTVSGTTTTVDSTTVEFADNIIALNGTGAANGGIEVNDGPASGSILWDGTNNYWIAGAKGSENEILTTGNVDADIKTLSLPASTNISAFGATLVDDADAAAARTTLGVDASGTDNSTDVTLTGTPDYITISGQVITVGTVDIADDTNFAVSDTTGQTGINLTLTDDTVSGVVSGLDTDNDVQFDSFGVGTAASGTTGEIRATGDITAYYSSDERLKENFEPLTGALDKVKAMGGYEFDWKDGIGEIVSKTGHDVGVKAQEVKAQYPELVHERDNGYLAVDYIKLNAVLIEAVKELAAKVEELSK